MYYFLVGGRKCQHHSCHNSPHGSQYGPRPHACAKRGLTNIYLCTSPAFSLSYTYPAATQSNSFDLQFYEIFFLLTIYIYLLLLFVFPLFLFLIGCTHSTPPPPSLPSSKALSFLQPPPPPFLLELFQYYHHHLYTRTHTLNTIYPSILW